MVNNNYHQEPGTLLCQLIFTNCYFHFSEVEAEGQSHWTYSSHSVSLLVPLYLPYFLNFFFLTWTVFPSLLNLLQCCFCFTFCFFGLEAHGILAPLGIEPSPPALEGKVLTTGPLGKSLYLSDLAKVKRRVPSF